MTAYRSELPPLPPSLRMLQIDDRGYPVPWFVAWIDAKPDHRIADARKAELARENKLCWVCGKKLKGDKAFLIGPMCAVNRVSAEPPQHLECALYSVRACPFLTRPHAHRRENNLPDESNNPAGFMIRRNPGVVLLWVTRSFTLECDGDGFLYRLGDPIKTLWFAEGRAASREEVMASIDSGLPILRGVAEQDGAAALRELDAATQLALELVPTA